MRTTWSISRDQALQTCERRYYFQYLAPAKINSRDETLREIALLKKLKNIPMWQGELFHSLVADYLQGIRQRTPDLPLTLLNKSKARIKREWEASASTFAHISARPVNNSGNVILFEHEYNETPINVDYTDVAHRIENLFWKFVGWVKDQGLVRSIQRAKNIWIEPQMFGPQAPGFEVDGVKVLIKVDLALLTGDERFEIFDWKTGTLSSHPAGAMSQAEFQVAVYQLWPHLAFHHPLDAIRAHLVYVGAEAISQQTFDIDQNILAFTLGLVRRSIAHMLFYDNGYQNAELSLDDFDFAAIPSSCQKCSFKRLCRRALEI